MSRRKQPNPAKLEETELQDSKDDHLQKKNDNSFRKVKKSSAIEVEEENTVVTNNNGKNLDFLEENSIKVEEFDEDHEDSLGSVGTNQASWDSNTPEQASPASSSCPTPSSLVHDVIDAEAFTVGVTETTPHACKICNKAFTKSSLLSKHEQTHADGLQYNCNFCPRLFKHKRSRDRHIKLHTGDKKYKCTFCETAFSRSDHLKIHLKTHDNSKPFKCFLCNRGYNTAAALTSHQQCHIKQDNKCDKIINESEDDQLISDGQHSCTFCSETFAKLELLQVHISSRHLEISADNSADDLLNEKTKWLCMYCAKDFLSLEELQQHVNSSHKMIIDSKSDDSSSKSSSQMKEDQRAIYPCYNCTKQFYSLEKLKDHITGVHWENEGQQRLSSDTVLKDFNICLPSSQNTPLSTAPISEAPENNQSIQLTPTDLTWKRKSKLVNENEPSKKFHSNLNGQQGVLEGCENNKSEWPIYICNICGTKMPNFSSFMLHMDNHIPGNDLNNSLFLDYCPLCGEPCRDQLEVNNHILVHAISLKLGKCCGICKKVFNYNSDELQKHLLDSHTSTTYKCSLCKENFDVKSEVLIHMTKRHSNECQHYRCKFCPNQLFHDRLDAEVHISQHTPQLFNSLCRKITPYPSSDNSLSELQTKLKTNQCPLCHKCFQTEQHQYVHIMKEHKDIRELYTKRILEMNSDITQKNIQSDQSISSLTSITPLDILGYERLRCEICNSKDFLNERDLLAHKKLHQSKSKAVSVSLYCAYCNELCRSRVDLENHMKSHQTNSSKGKHKCNICDEIFQSGMTLAEHKLSHCKIISGNSCTHCKTILTDENAFYNHQLQHTTIINKPNSQISLPANCIICCQTLQSEVEIKLHANFHLKHLFNKEVTCNVCNASCDTSDGPLLPINNEGNSVYVCKKCLGKNGTNSASNSPLYSTVKQENAEIITCPQCHQIFQTKEKAMRHLTSHGKFDSGSNHVCHLCKSYFTTALKLQVHVIEHNFFGSGQFRCYICSSIFTTVSALLSHMLKHGSSSKPYECNQCQMKFFFQTELDNHKEDHLTSVPQQSYPQNSLFPANSSDANSSCQCYEYSWSPSVSEKHIQFCPLQKALKKEQGLNVSPNNEINLKKEISDDNFSSIGNK